MLNLFPIRDPIQDRDRIQSRLMSLATLILLAYALALSIAPAVRRNSGSEVYQFRHWLGVVGWLFVFILLHRLTIKQLPHRDPYLLPLVSFLVGIGVLTIWRLSPELGQRQTLWMVVGGSLIYAGLQFPKLLLYLRRYKYICLVIGLVLTVMTVLLGRNPTGVGPRLWLNIFGIYLQPSEPLKLLLIIYLAGYFTDNFSKPRRGLRDILPTLIVISLAILLLAAQRDLGTASIFLLIYLAMLFTANSDRRVLWVALTLFTIVGIVGYFLIDIVQLRINAWLSPFSDPTGTSYQVVQSLIAIAEGGVIGAGPGLGSPNLIPVAASDFIFSAIAEELGFVGILTLIAALILLIYRCTKTALNTRQSFNRYLALGLIDYLGIQSILIIGGNLGLLPLTGVTLPFVSYGGSSLNVSFASLLFLLLISSQREEPANQLIRIQHRCTLISQALIGFLVVEIFVSSLLSFWVMPSFVNRIDNPRWIIDDLYVKRGSILDRNEKVIITTIGEVGAYQRMSNHPPLYPVVGYTSAIYGQTGIEDSMFSYLRGFAGYPEQTLLWQDLLRNQPPPGLNVRLTIDLDLQIAVDSLLNDTHGAAVLMNAQTGEILVMASHPYFDAEKLEEEWETLINSDAAPLLNRVTQGSYSPGASLLPFILAAQPELIQLNLKSDILDGKDSEDLGCALSVTGDSEPEFAELISGGCYGFQEELVRQVDTEVLLDTFQKLGFYNEPKLRLPVVEAGKRTETVEEPQDLLENLKVSPLQMALAASALTFEGNLPAPRLVNGYEDPDGVWVTLPKLAENQSALPPTNARTLLAAFNENGTSFWSVTATVTDEHDFPITWFIAGTTSDWQGQPLVLVILLESENPHKTETIGKTILEQVIRK